MRLKEYLALGLIGHKFEAVKRTIRFVNLDTAKTAGIIWTGRDSHAFESLVRILGKKQIKWTDLCFADEKATVQSANPVSRKDFSFFGKPRNVVILDFIHTDFDLLIDISLSSSGYAQTIRRFSRASLKVGWSKAVPDFFDFRIDVSKRPEPEFLVEQLTHYLSEIKTD